MLASCLVAAILLAISAVHLYWATGGTAGKAGAIPSLGGAPVIRPSRAGTATVGLAIAAVAALALATSGVLPTPAPRRILQAASALLALVFAVRAVGDFRYVGFFKRVRGTLFARRDTLCYSPLCCLIAALLVLTALG